MSSFKLGLRRWQRRFWSASWRCSRARPWPRSFLGFSGGCSSRITVPTASFSTQVPRKTKIRLIFDIYPFSLDYPYKYILVICRSPTLGLSFSGSPWSTGPAYISRASSSLLKEYYSTRCIPTPLQASLSRTPRQVLAERLTFSDSCWSSSSWALFSPGSFYQLAARICSYSFGWLWKSSSHCSDIIF